MAGWPLLAGTVISKTPYSFLVISCESRFHPSGRLSANNYRQGLTSRTEIADEVCSQGVWCPLSIGNISIVMDGEAEFFKALNDV